jgi:hypothetical protein
MRDIISHPYRIGISLSKLLGKLEIGGPRKRPKQRWLFMTSQARIGLEAQKMKQKTGENGKLSLEKLHLTSINMTWGVRACKLRNEIPD